MATQKKAEKSARQIQQQKVIELQAALAEAKRDEEMEALAEVNKQLMAENAQLHEQIAKSSKAIGHMNKFFNEIADRFEKERTRGLSSYQRTRVAESNLRAEMDKKHGRTEEDVKPDPIQIETL